MICQLKEHDIGYIAPNALTETMLINIQLKLYFRNHFLISRNRHFPDRDLDSHATRVYSSNKHSQFQDVIKIDSIEEKETDTKVVNIQMINT